MPKGRYRVMRAYLPTRGALAHEMMKRTTTVQANLDYEYEDDAMEKLRVAMGLSSLVTSLFAASPLVDGKLARLPELPRARLARHRSRSLRPVAVRAARGRALPPTTPSGRSTCRCSSSTAAASTAPPAA